ncbi:RND transporter [uncultured Klebsiella sp.]|uniref:RND transporter n=1 Tax=uncultured Klebsiella sp. TaxID=284011 RepID=UPI002805E3AC|nr:RND transporter [uncultured Klebsiella sp.]
MGKVKFVLLLATLSSVSFSSAASYCESNNIGGQLCFHDDGTTSSSIPNGVNGFDTYSSDGKWSSTMPDLAGTKEDIEGSTLPNDDDVTHSSSSESDNTLMGKDWNSAANIQSDGAATSSAAIVNAP